MEIREAEALQSLDGLEDLASVNEISIVFCPQLVRLRALSSLKSVTNGCRLFETEKLPTCEARWLQRLIEGLGASFSGSTTDDTGVCG